MPTPLKPFKKILVPVDFSAHAERALHAAADLCRRYEAAAATVLHVWEPELFVLPDSYQLYDPAQLPRWPDQFAARLGAAKDAMQVEGPLEVHVALSQGAPAAEIVRFADEGKFDLIVMGTHGRTGLAHVLQGSVAEYVVRRASCPVMTVHLDDPKVPAQEHASTERMTP
jgi:nucleotide-binding universal stress UspA family protein